MREGFCGKTDSGLNFPNRSILPFLGSAVVRAMTIAGLKFDCLGALQRRIDCMYLGRFRLRTELPAIQFSGLPAIGGFRILEPTIADKNSSHEQQKHISSTNTNIFLIPCENIHQGPNLGLSSASLLG